MISKIRDVLMLVTKWLFVKVASVLEPSGDLMVSHRYRDNCFIDFKGHSKNTYVGMLIITTNHILLRSELTLKERDVARNVLLENILEKVEDEFLCGESVALPGTCTECQRETKINIEETCYDCFILTRPY